MVLNLLKKGQVAESLKIIKWLATQRNSYGGFKSTQDTMIAMQALAEYSKIISQEDNNLSVQMTSGHDFRVTEDNKLLLQMEKVDLDSIGNTPINAEVSGQGCLLIQSILRYNGMESEEKNSFTLKISQNNDNMLKACASYTGSREVTNMVVMEIELLSGFEPINLEELKNNKLVKKVEFDEKENNIAIYFNEMKKEEQCYDLKLEEKIPVKDRKAAIARIYDYYYRKAAIA